MASPAYASLWLLVFISISLCSAHRLLLEAANVAKNSEPKLLYPRNPFQRELLASNLPVLPKPLPSPVIPFERAKPQPSPAIPFGRGKTLPSPVIPLRRALVRPHNPAMGEKLPLHNSRHHHAEIKPPEVELLHQGKSSFTNGKEPKLPMGDWEDTELGLPGSRPSSSDINQDLPGSRTPGSDWEDADMELGLPGPYPPGSDMELLHQGQSSFTNSEPKPPVSPSGSVRADTELGLTEPWPPHSDLELGLPGPSYPPKFGSPIPQPSGSD